MNVSSPAEGRMNIEGHVLQVADFAKECMWIKMEKVLTDYQLFST